MSRPAAATAVILVILAGIKPLEERFQQRHRSHEIVAEAEPGGLSVAALEAALGYRARRITRYVARPGENEGTDEISITLTRLSPRDIEEIVRDLAKVPGVRRVSREPR